MHGNITKPDFVKVSEYIKRDYDKVYIVKNFAQKSGFDIKNIYGHLISDYQLIDISEEVNLDIDGKDKVVVIIPKEFEITIKGANKLDIETEHIDMYENIPSNGEINIKLKEESLSLQNA